MLEQVARFVGLFCVGLAAGIASCVLLANRVWSGSARFYTELMQLLIRALTVPAPALGAVAMVAMAVDAWWSFHHGQVAMLSLTLVALALNVFAAALTKFGHFPMNDRMMKWDPAAPPADWMRVQARWSAFHMARTFAVVGSFGFFLLRNSS